MSPILRKIILYVYLFLVIYTPTFWDGILFDKYIMLYALLAIGLTPYIIRRKLADLTLLRQRNAIILILFASLASIYLMASQIFNGVEISSLSDTRLIQNNLISVMVIHVAIILDQFKKIGYSKTSAILALSKLAAIQGLYGLLSLALTPLKSFSDTLYGLSGGFNTFVMDARIFGISSDFTFGTPIYHGILAALLLYITIIHKKASYLIYVFLILAATFLNNRTGVVAFILLSAFLLVYAAIKKGKIVPVLLTTLLLGGVSLVSFNSLNSLSPSTYNFITSFTEDTDNLIKGNPTGNYEILLNDYSAFSGSPPNTLFGSGYRIYDEQGKLRAGFRTDMGYLNDLYYGGVVYMVLLYGCFIYFMLYKSKGRKYLFISLLVILFLVNIKGEIFRSNIVIFLFIYIKLIFQSVLRNGRRSL